MFLNKALKCVFIDQNIPFNDDNQRDGIAGFDSINPNIYYKKVGEFLDKEGILILEHPKSNYDAFDWWGGRARVKGRTKEFLEKADVVFAHYSSALNYAKTSDIRFLSYPELHWKIRDKIEAKAKEYGKEVICI